MFHNWKVYCSGVDDEGSNTLRAQYLGTILSSLMENSRIALKPKGYIELKKMERKKEKERKKSRKKKASALTSPDF